MCTVYSSEFGLLFFWQWFYFNNTIVLFGHKLFGHTFGHTKSQNTKSQSFSL